MNIPKNLKFPELLKEKELKLNWEFDLNNKKICIQCFYIFSSKIYKILYNEKVIKEEKYDDNYNFIKFIEEDHCYELILILDSYNFTLFIDKKSFKDLYKKEKELNNSNEKIESKETGINIGNEVKINGINFINEDLMSPETRINYENENEASYETEINGENNKFGNNYKNENINFIDKSYLKFDKNFNIDKNINIKVNNGIIIRKKCHDKMNNDFNEKGSDFDKKRKKLNDKFLINIKFFRNDLYIFYTKSELSGLLNLCLIKYMADFIDNEFLEKIPPKIKNIIIKLQNNIDFTNDKKDDLKLLLEEKNGNNILIYSQYVNMLIKSKYVNKIIKYLNKDIQNKINNYWRCLSNYEEYNSFFEKEFQKDLKNTYFDYSLISLAILENIDKEDYNTKRDSCNNVKKKILYHNSQINPISSILTDEFKYTKKAFYGMGIYFSDLIDYTSFYCGEIKFSESTKKFYRSYFGKTIKLFL